MELQLLRTYDPKAVNGEIWYNDIMLSYCIELPWKDNRRRVSCIPEGSYDLAIRVSEKFGQHLLVVGVPNRDLILLHPANVALRELAGCISPVMELTGIGEGRYSRKALSSILSLVLRPLERREKVTLIIKERV